MAAVEDLRTSASSSCHLEVPQQLDLVCDQGQDGLSAHRSQKPKVMGEGVGATGAGVGIQHPPSSPPYFPFPSSSYLCDLFSVLVLFDERGMDLIANEG